MVQRSLNLQLFHGWQGVTTAAHPLFSGVWGLITRPNKTTMGPLLWVACRAKHDQKAEGTGIGAAILGACFLCSFSLNLLSAKQTYDCDCGQQSLSMQASEWRSRLSAILVLSSTRDRKISQTLIYRLQYIGSITTIHNCSVLWFATLQIS